MKSTNEGSNGLPLLPHHLKLLAECSAISTEVIAERGYATIPDGRGAGKLLRAAGINERHADNLPGIKIPVYNVLGELAFHQVRFDHPPIVSGRASKYLFPYGSKMVVDVPRRIRPYLGDPAIPLWVTEGSKKVDALISAGLIAVGLAGVWNWRGTNSHGGKVILPDFESIAFNGREIHVVFDSDVMMQESVRLALERFREVARLRDGDVVLHYLPPGEHGAKTGVDDFFAAGRTVADLMGFATRELRPPSSTASRDEPAPPKVPAPDGADLVKAVRGFVCRFVVLPSKAAEVALALFIIHTWAFSAAHSTPYIGVLSPEKRSGKTRLLEVAGVLCRNARRSASISAAALYQMVSEHQPTLMIDEVDALFRARGERAEDLRAMLDGGNRPGSPVTRGTREGEAVDFDVYCPKLLAGIGDGTLPDTVADRAISIRMQRKQRGEKAERWRPRLIAAEAEALRDQLYAWAHEHTEELAAYQVPDNLVADFLDDRSEEAWEPLLAIANLCGVLDDAVVAAKALAADKIETAEDQAHIVLVAVHDYLGRQPTGQAFTKDMLTAMNSDEEAPFGQWHKGRGITQYDLRSKLGIRYGIRSKDIHIGGVHRKGYDVADFATAWGRYGDEPQDADATAPEETPTTPPPSSSGVAVGAIRASVPSKPPDRADARMAPIFPPEASDGGVIEENPLIPCDDPSNCRFRNRHASGPWDCEHNHPAFSDERNR